MGGSIQEQDGHFHGDIFTIASDCYPSRGVIQHAKLYPGHFNQHILTIRCHHGNVPEWIKWI
jgi:hypothetical protein